MRAFAFARRARVYTRASGNVAQAREWHAREKKLVRTRRRPKMRVKDAHGVDARNTRERSPVAIERRKMAWTNFIVTAAGLLAVASLMRTDVRQSSAMLRRNLKQIRHWVEDGSVSSASKEAMKDATKTLGETPVGKAMKEMRDEQFKGKK